MQTLKQNTDPSDRREISTQTLQQHLLQQQQQQHQHQSSQHSSPSMPKIRSSSQRGNSSHHNVYTQNSNTNTTGSAGSGGGGRGGDGGSIGGTNKRSSAGLPLHASSEEKLTTEILSSPRGRQSFRYVLKIFVYFSSFFSLMLL